MRTWHLCQKYLHRSATSYRSKRRFLCNLPGSVLLVQKVNCTFLVVLQSYMDSEIRAIMAQYMPLDSQAEVVNHVNDERA